MLRAIGLVEYNSIAQGIESTDAMVKAAQVELLEARTICPGKYMALISGEVSAVETAVERGKERGQTFVVDHFILANVEPTVLAAITATTELTELKALGVIEVFSIATAIVAADTAVKKAEIELIELRLGIGIGGKSYLSLTGDVGAVETAVEAAVEVIKESGMLVNKIIIPSPHKDMVKWVI